MAKPGKLTPEMIAEIGKLKAEGMARKDIRRKFDISDWTYSSALNKFNAAPIPDVVAETKTTLTKKAYKAVGSALTDEHNIQQAGRLGLDYMSRIGEISSDQPQFSINLQQTFAKLPEDWRSRYIMRGEIERIESALEAEGTAARQKVLEAPAQPVED
jgi:hypothetical protein